MVSLGCGRQGGRTGRTTQADDIAVSFLGFVLEVVLRCVCTSECRKEALRGPVRIC